MQFLGGFLDFWGNGVFGIRRAICDFRLKMTDLGRTLVVQRKF